MTYETDIQCGVIPVSDVPLWGVDCVKSDGVFAHRSVGSPDIFITKSLFYTRAEYCSPHLHNTCPLRYPDPEGKKAYCLPHGWFEGGEAPYPVYCVEDDSLILPPHLFDTPAGNVP